MQQKRNTIKANCSKYIAEIKELKQKIVELETINKKLEKINQTKQSFFKVSSETMLKALQYHGYNQPDLKSWWTDGKMIEFVTLSGYIKQVQITDLDS